MIKSNISRSFFLLAAVTIWSLPMSCDSSQEGFTSLEETASLKKLSGSDEDAKKKLSGSDEDAKPVKISEWQPQEETIVIGQQESLTFAVSLQNGGDPTVEYTFTSDGVELGKGKNSFMNLTGSSFGLGEQELVVSAKNSINEDSHTFKVKRNSAPKSTLVSPSEKQVQVACTTTFSVFSATFDDEVADTLNLTWTINGEAVDPNVIVVTKPTQSQIIFENSCSKLSSANILKLVADDGHDQTTTTWIYSVIDPNASFGGIGNSALEFNPLSVDFGNLMVGSQSATEVVTVMNVSSVDVYLETPTVGNANFVIAYSACPVAPNKLVAGGSCVFGVKFNPSVSASLGTNVLFKFGPSPTDTGSYSSSIALSGNGVGALNFSGLDSITAVTHNSLQLNWTATPAAVSFTVFRVVGTSLEYIETLLNTGGAIVGKAYSGLFPGATYTYRVRATDVFGISDSNTNDIVVNMLPNTVPSLTPVANPTVYAGKLADAIDVNDQVTGLDTDPDGDNISYTCKYDNVIDGVVSPVASDCSSIANEDPSTVSFNIYTALLTNWRPKFSQTGLPFEFKITGTDAYAASGSVIFSTTVQSGHPQIQTVNSQTFPSNEVNYGQVLSHDVNNIRYGTPTDELMTYSCTFVKIETTGPTAPVNCTSLPGTVTFYPATGVFSWTTDVTSVGAYTLTFTGTNGGGSDSQSANFSIIVPYTRSNAVLDLHAGYANNHGPGLNGASFLSTWSDVSGTVTSGNLFNFATTSWTGTGAAASPYALSFDGTNDYVEFGSDNNNHAQFTVETWIKATDATRSDQIIVSNGDASDLGFTISNRRFQTGGGVSGYAAAVIADSPAFYWRFDDITGTTVTDAMGNRDGVITNPSLVAINTESPMSDLGDQSLFTSPSGHVDAGNYPLASDWSIETWFKYPMPGNCSNGGWCTLTRGSAADRQIIVKSGTLKLGTYLSSGAFKDSGYSLSGLADGWHHLVAVAESGSTTFYIDGASVGTIAFASASNIRSVGGYWASQPFGYFDEFALYDYPLTAMQVANHFAASQTFDNCSYQMVPDYWYQLGAVVNETGSTVSAYLNGEVVCTFSIVNAPGITGSSEPLRLGRSYAGATGSWTGQMAELRLHNVADATILTNNFTAKKNSYSPYLPIPAAGLVTWLNASNQAYQDLAGTTPAGNGDTVALWKDRTGSNGDVSQSNGTFRPKLITGALNGEPVLEFDGTNDRIDNLINYGTPSTVIYVGRILGANKKRVLGGRVNNWLLGYYNGRKDTYFANGWINNANTPVVDGEWNLFVGDLSGANYGRIFTNGIQVKGATGGTQGLNGLSLGGSSSQYSYSQVAEVIIYDRLLTTSERQQIEAYLNAKYAIY